MLVRPAWWWPILLRALLINVTRARHNATPPTMCCTLSLHHSYGDGWSGNTFELNTTCQAKTSRKTPTCTTLAPSNTTYRYRMDNSCGTNHTERDAGECTMTYSSGSSITSTDLDAGDCGMTACTTDCSSGANRTELDAGDCTMIYSTDCSSGANCTELDARDCTMTYSTDCVSGANRTELDAGDCTMIYSTDCLSGANRTEADAGDCTMIYSTDCSSGANRTELDAGGCTMTYSKVSMMVDLEMWDDGNDSALYPVNVVLHAAMQCARCARWALPVLFSAFTQS